jgi:pimeloyl-ACP methyl ester carboxylesterase
MRAGHFTPDLPERQGSVRLPDGRRLAWSEWGPVDGLPVLFCTGAGLSGTLGFGTGDLDPLGLRLLAIDRPGLGASDPHPAKTLRSWTEDVRRLAGTEQLRSPVAVGFSQGAPFALALGGAGVAEAVAVVSGQDQLAHPAVRRRLPADVAGLLDARERDADGLERQVSRDATANWLHGMILVMSGEADLAVYAEPAFDRAFRRALREGFAQGAVGYARDLVNALGPWPFEPEGIRVPVDLWYGARDASPVHSPDHGASLAARFPRATLHLVPDAGGALLWTHAHDILATLARRVRATGKEAFLSARRQCEPC